MPEPVPVAHIMSCPRCDRKVLGRRSQTKTADVDAFELLKTHVARAHPEYDPDWSLADGPAVGPIPGDPPRAE